MENKWQITENPLETNGSKASLYLTKLYNGELGSEFIADFEKPDRANEVCNKLNEYAELKAKCDRYEALITQIYKDGPGNIDVMKEVNEALSSGEGNKEVENG